MSAPAAPDLLIVGQVTIDDVVPAAPGPWQRQIGGSSLYAVAGARHWIAPERIGLVACVGQDYPFDVQALLGGIGVRCVLTQFDAPHLIEWLIYEPDGSRRSLPRNPELLAIGAEGSWSQPAPAALDAAMQARLLQIAPGLRHIPETWCTASAVHLCPQVGNRHSETVRGLAGRVGWMSVDPSPITRGWRMPLRSHTSCAESPLCYRARRISRTCCSGSHRKRRYRHCRRLGFRRSCCAEVASRSCWRMRVNSTSYP